MNVNRVSSERFGSGIDVGRLVRRQRIHKQPGDTARRVSGGQIAKRGKILAADRAARARHGDDGRLLIRERAQLMVCAANFGEREICHHPADAVIASFKRPRTLAERCVRGYGCLLRGCGRRSGWLCRGRDCCEAPTPSASAPLASASVMTPSPLRSRCLKNGESGTSSIVMRPSPFLSSCLKRCSRAWTADGCCARPRTANDASQTTTRP